MSNAEIQPSNQESTEDETSMQDENAPQHRIRHDKRQVEALEMLYSVDKYPKKPELLQLCSRLGLSVKSAGHWFVKRRLKDRKNGVGVENGKTIVKEQLNQIFEDVYIRCNFPSKDQMKVLQSEFDLKESMIKRWFYNRKIREMEQKGKLKEANAQLVEPLDESQSKTLNDFYRMNKFPNESQMEELSLSTGLAPEKIRIWMKKKERESKEAIVEIHSDGFESTKDKVEEREKIQPRKIWRPSEIQVRALEDLYVLHKHPNRKVMQELCYRLGLDVKNVYHWFVNKRSKDRKRGIEIEYKKLRLTKEKYQRFEEIYLESGFPREEQSRDLQRQFGLDVATIENWFRNRRSRESLKTRQNSILEGYYASNRYPTNNQCEEFAVQLNLSKKFIKKWFADRRAVKSL